MVRSPCCEKVGLKRGRWTAEEDAILINYIQQYGEGSWKSLPKNAGLLRCGKSCRLRWINYLRSDLKRGNFTIEEEEIIIDFHRSLGNRWSLIASHLPGRTDNEVKNYWNSHLSRKLYTFTSNKTNGSILKTSAIDLINMPNTTKKRGGGGGRVSRSIAKKYNTHSRNPIELQQHLSGAENATTTKKDRGAENVMEEEKHVIKTVVKTEEKLQNLSRMKEDKGGLMKVEKHDEAELWGCSDSTSPKDLETDDCFLTTLLDQDWTFTFNDTHSSWDPNTQAQNLDKTFSFPLKNDEWDVDNNDNWLWI